MFHSSFVQPTNHGRPKPAQWKPIVWVRGRLKPQTSRPSARNRSWHIFLHSNSNQRHSLQSFQRPPWNENSRLRPFMYWYSGINGTGGLLERCVNWPYQYHKAMGMNKKFIRVSQSNNFHSYSLTIMVAARRRGSKSRCGCTGDQRHLLLSSPSWLERL